MPIKVLFDNGKVKYEESGKKESVTRKAVALSANTGKETKQNKTQEQPSVEKAKIKTPTQTTGELSQGAKNFIKSVEDLKLMMLMAQDSAIAGIYSKAKQMGAQADTLYGNYGLDPQGSAYTQDIVKGRAGLRGAESALGYERPLLGDWSANPLTAAQLRGNATESLLSGDMDLSTYEKVMNSLRSVGDAENQKKAVVYGLQNRPDTTAGAKKAASAATDRELEALIAGASDPANKKIYQQEQQSRKPGAVEKIARQAKLYGLLESVEPGYIERLADTGMDVIDQDVKDRINLNIERIDAALKNPATGEHAKKILENTKLNLMNGIREYDGEVMGPESPDVYRMRELQAEGGDKTYTDQYVDKNRQQARDWSDAKDGTYRGDDKELAEYTAKRTALEDEYNAAQTEADFGFHFDTGLPYTTQEREDAQRRADEAKAKLDALDAQADEKIREGREAADAVKDTVKVMQHGEGSWWRLVKAFANDALKTMSANAATALGMVAKPFELAIKSRSANNEILGNIVLGKIDKAEDLIQKYGDIPVEVYKNGGVQKIMDWYSGEMQKAQEEAYHARKAMSDSPILDVAYEAAKNIVLMAPDVLMNLASGGGTTAADVAVKMQNAMMDYMESLTQSQMTNLMRAMASDAGFLMSLIREWGDDVQQNTDAGIPAGWAEGLGTLTAIMDAMVEIGGGGIQDIGKTDDPGWVEDLYQYITGKTMTPPAGIAKLAVGAANSALPEALEEGGQSIVSGAMAQPYMSWTGNQRPLLSLTPGEDAMINAPDTLKEMGMGGLVGGIMGGTLDPIINAAAQRGIDAETGRAILKNDWGEALGSAAQAAGQDTKTAQKLREGQKVNPRRVGKLYRNYYEDLDAESEQGQALRQAAGAMMQVERGKLTEAGINEAINKAEGLAKTAKISADGKPHVNRIGQQVNAEAAEEAVAERPVELVGVEVNNGKAYMKVRVTDGNVESVAFEDVQFPDEATAERAAIAATVGGEEAANTVYNAKEPNGVDFKDFAKDFLSAMQGAALGLKSEAIKVLGIAKNLANQELETAVWAAKQAGEKLKEQTKKNAKLIKEIMDAQRETVREQIRAKVAEKVQPATGSEKTDNTIVNAAVEEAVGPAYKLALGEKISDAEAETLKAYGVTKADIDALKEIITPLDAEEETSAEAAEQIAPEAAGEAAPTGSAEAGEHTAFEYGRSGRSMEELTEEAEAQGWEMTSGVRLAYTRGETARRQAEEARNSRIQELNSQGRTDARKGTLRTVAQEDIDSLREKGIDVLPAPEKWSERQQAAVDSMRAFAEEAGFHVALFESPKNEKGVRVGANGFYDPKTETIYIDMFAGQENEEAMMTAFAHEMTHWIQRWSPTEYRKMQDFLIGAFYGKGKNTVKLLVQHQIEKAAEDGRRITEAEAMDEITADASEMMFEHPERIREMAEKNPTLYERIKSWLNRLCESLRRAMQGVDAESPEARLLTGMQEKWEQYREKWYAGAADAAANMRYAADGNAQTTRETAATQAASQTTTETQTAEETASAAPAAEAQTINSKAPSRSASEAAKTANTGVAYTNDQTPVQFHYELVPADSLITSNNQRFEANPEYPQELQPRDRSRQASRDQVWSIARGLNPARLGESADVQNGAPIVGPDMVVESGNGRTMAIRYAMQNDPAAAGRYTQWLRQNAARFGLDASSVQPDSVLVRVRDSALNRVAFVKQANESTTAAYSESETAESDAEKLTPEIMEIFSPGENGSLTNADNAGFTARFLDGVIPAAERGNYVQQDGTISQRGIERIQNAIFQKAYGSAALTQMLSEAVDDTGRNLMRALTQTAGRAAQLAETVRNGGAHDLRLGDEITQAAKRYLQLKRDGYKVDTYLNQTAMPGVQTETEGQKALMRLFEDMNRSPKKLAGVLNAAMDVIEEYGDPRQVSMLGDSQAPTLENVIAQAVSREARTGEEVKFSSRDTARDEAYMRAVEEGDTEEAQRIVDEAAETAMQNSQIRDDDGRLLVVYHGTSENFTVFDMSKGRANMDIQGSFFSPWDDDASGYGENVGKYYLNITNPAPEGTAYRALNMFKGQNGAGVKAREYLISQGYDGVNNSGEEYIAFYPEQIKSADAVTYDDQGNVITLSERFNQENNDIRFSNRFNYMKPFAEQVDEYMDPDKRKKLFGNDGLLIGTTPQVLQDVGLLNTIVAIDQKHAGYSLLGNYNGNERYGRDHMISPEEFKKLPEKLANPIAVIAAPSTHDLIIFIDMQNVDGKQVIMPYRLESGIEFNGKTRDVQRVKTVYGEEKAENMLRKAILNDSDEQIRLYYWDKKRAQQVAGLGVHEYANSLPDGLIHKITDAGSPVKPQITAQTQTSQFKNWFGNSVMTENGKAQGKPRVFYHGTNSGGFTVFDKDMIGKAREGDVGFFGRGFYFAYSKGEAETYGRDVIEAYLKIDKPFNFQKELDTYAGERTNDYNASRAVFVTNLADKLPELANRHRVEIYPKNGGDVREMSLKEFAAEFKRAVNEVEYRVDDLGNGEWVVLADPERYSYTRPDGTEDSWTDYNYQQKFYSQKDAENKLTRAFYYLQNTLGTIRIPASASIVQEVDFGKAVQARGYDGIIQSETGDEAVVFEPTQIKSTNNTGMFDAQNPDIRWSNRDTEYRTTRQILADALTSLAANESERQMLEGYKDAAARLDANEQRIAAINAELRDARWTEPNSDREKALLSERKQLEAEITAADKRLYEMERMAPMKRIAQQQRARAESDLARAKEHLRRYREGVAKRESIARIERTSRRLTKWLTAPAGKSSNYVPESLRKPLGEFLLTIDKMSQQRRAGGPMTEEDKKFAYQLSQIEHMLRSIDDAQQEGTAEERINSQYGMYLDLPKDFNKNLSELVRRTEERMQSAGARENMLDQMSQDELEALDQSLTAISSSITHINDFLTDTFKKSVSETAEQTIGEMGQYREMKRQSKWAKKVGDYLTWDNVMPAYAFDRLGESGRQVFQALRDGQGTLARNAKRVIDESADLYDAKEAQAWSKEIKKFDFGPDNVIRMPVSHLMSLYALSRREQAMGHLLGEGFRVADYEEGRKTVHDKGHVISEAQLQKMLDSLTPRQKEVAEGMQRLMSTLGSDWGNYVSMRRFGYKQFTEKNYFPIKSDSDLLAARTDEGKGNELYKLLNMSMTKPLTMKANNRLMLESIFDVFGSHMSDMAQYNALALPVLDAVKWFNYKASEMDENGSAKYTQGVRDSIRNAFGQQGIKYLTEFLKDINGGGMVGDTSGNLYQKALGKYNRVAVAANLRVALLQPLAIIRAGMELPGTSLAAGTMKAVPNLKNEIKEMQKHSGIALWKDLGYREMNIGRSVKQQIQHMETWQDKVSDKSMALAGLMDNVTWGAMWKASKEYIAKTRRDLTIGSKDYFDAVTKKFEDVIYKTQVVDSPLTKSQLMRSQNAFNKLIGSFMSEPTTTFNTLMGAWDKMRLAMKKGKSFSEAFRENGAKMGRTMYYFLLAAAVQTAVEQLMTAHRDDDDYEKFGEKYMDGLWETLIDNLNPLELLPGVKQIWETAGKKLLGMSTYDEQSVLTQGYSTVVDAAGKIKKLIDGSDKVTVYGAAYTLAKGLSMTTGLPISPVMREAQAMWNEVVPRIKPGWRWESSPTPNGTGYDAMYSAYGEGDQERYDSVMKRMSERGLDEKAIQNAMSDRIKKDYLAGQISAAEAETRLVDLADKDENKAYFTVQKWGYEAENDDDYSQYGNLKAAMLTGTGVKEAEKELLDHGYTQKQVDSKKKSLITDAVKNGEITDAEATNLYVKYGDMDKNEAYFKVKGAHYEGEDADDTYSKYGDLEKAVLTGKGFEAAKRELTTHGVEEKDVLSQVKAVVTEQVVKHGMSDAQAMNLLQKYGGMNANEAWIRTQEMTYQKKTGKSTTSDAAMVYYAIDNSQSPKQAIDGLLAHGKEKKSIASSITSHYKEDYLELIKAGKTAQAAALKGRLISTFEYLGYNGKKKVEDWEKNSNKKSNK